MINNMEQKFIETNSGKAVSLGNYVDMFFEKKLSFGTIKCMERHLVTEESIPMLLKRGVIKKTDDEHRVEINEEVGYYVNKLANKLDFDVPHMCEWLEEMNKTFPQVVLSMLLKQISDEYVEKSGERISKHQGPYYYISNIDGKIRKLEKLPDNVAFIKYVSLFKKEGEANFAKHILKNQFKLMYGRE